MTLANEVYSELILDHARRPRNHHAMEDPSVEVEGYNPLCGDKVTVYLRGSDDDQSISDMTFVGSGCAICMASASLMTEVTKGQPVDTATAMADTFQGNMTGQREDDDELPEKLQALLGVRAYPMRVKCATLPWHTLKKAIKTLEASKESHGVNGR